jgi:hypothetical protein
VGAASIIADDNFTRQYIPEDNSEHHTRRRENLKSHIIKQFSYKHNAFFACFFHDLYTK